MKKKIVVVVLLLLMLTLPGCGKKQDSQENSRPTVTVVEAKSELLTVDRVYDAVLELGEEQFVSARVAGHLRYFYRNEGEEVYAGEKLALLENQGASLARERQEQEVEIARIQDEKLQARLEESTKELERKKYLFQAEAISRVELDKSELEWQLLLQDKEQAERQLQLALIKQEESDLNAFNCEIIAPDRLWLAEKMVKAGQFVNAGQAVFRAGKRNHLLANIAVPEAEAAEWQVGDKLEVKLQAEVREAIVQSINRTTHPGSSRVTVALQVENPDLDWLPGSMVEVKYSKEMGEQLLIPAEAIAQGEYPYVYIIKEELVQRQRVSLGTVEGSRVTVYGLPEGSLVVTGGLQRLRDGDAVNIKEDR